MSAANPGPLPPPLPAGPGHIAAPQPFGGFRQGTRPIVLPAEFFSELVPQIESEAELRVVLHALYVIKRGNRSVLAVRRSELEREIPLLQSLDRCGGASVLRPALDTAVDRGALLACPIEDGDVLYMENGPAGRNLRTRLLAGAEDPPAGARLTTDAVVPAARQTAARIYEQEIGSLTPAVASQLAEAEGRYATDWIVEALQLAATNNARSWRYAEAILRRWETEGRDDEATRGDARTADPYGHVYRRE